MTITDAAAIVTTLIAMVAILLSPLGRRLWKVLRKRYPKNFTIRVVAVMSQMEDVVESSSVWQHRSTMTLNLASLGDVFLVAKNPRAVLAITQVLEDYNWEIEMAGLRVRLNPKETGDMP